MSVFTIDTSAVSSVADSINGLSSKASSISSSVSGYDTSNEDGFNFDSAKNAIENNIKGIENKISNTAKLLETVAGTHESIQNSVNGGDTNSTDTSDTAVSNVDSGGYGGSSGGSSSRKSSTNGSVSTASEELNATASNLAFSTSVGDTLTGKLDDTSLPTVIENTTSSLITTSEGLGLNNLSARETLIAELGATAGLAISTLDDRLDITLSSNNIKVVEPDDLMVISNGLNVIVVEARTDDVELNQYLKRVSKVAEEFKIEVKLLKLDNIIGPTSINNSETITSSTETSPEQIEEIETKSTDTSKDFKTEVNSESSKIEKNEIINQTEYDKLVNMQPLGENNINNSPITMVLKDNRIKIAMDGYLTEMTIRSMLSLANL